MSSVNIYECSQSQPIESEPKYHKRGVSQSRISYTRDFLLSLSELDVCKKLPSGFDSSIISELEEASHTILERQRIPGSLSSQSFRRSEHGSSPPTRGDFSNYSRGSQGRWDSRSSDSNDKDADSQSERESDSGRRYGNQSRRSWQNSEHDGLLGSGAFVRPPGYIAGVSAPKVRGNGHYQLSRSNEPYHPPRPYKAVPHSRRDGTDSYNDETFGSTECSSQDRAEEERKRRDLFELMRKEQQKAFQEKHKQVSDKQKENFGTDITALLDGSEDELKLANTDNVSQASVVPLVSENDSDRFSFLTQTPASRPLVPPGFRTSVLEKNLGSKVLPPPAAEVINAGFGDSIEHANDNLVANGNYDNHNEKQSWCMDSSEQHYEAKSVNAPLVDEGERIVFPSSSTEVSDNSAGVSTWCKTSILSEACEGQNYGEVTIDTDKVTGCEIVNTTGRDHSTSILEKLFGSALTAKAVGSSSFNEHHEHDTKADDSGSSVPFQSSKFAHWFLEEAAEKKPVNDLSCGKPKDLLSLIVSSDRGGSRVSGVSYEKAMDHIPVIFPSENDELTSGFMASTATSAPVGISEPMYLHNKSGTTSGVLTCEDLEQSILLGINENSSSVQHFVQPWSVTDAKAEQPKADVDDLASQHLLSLLQKGTSIKDLAPFSNPDVVAPDKPNVYGFGSLSPVVQRSSERNTGNIQNSEKTLTLENLFGTAFMKELQSVEAPVSIHRGSTGGARRTDVSEPRGLPFPVSDDGLFSSTVGEFGSNTSSHKEDYLASKVKSEKIEGHWLGFNDTQIDLGSKFGDTVGFEDRADGTMDIKLPEEDSLITLADSVNPRNSTFMPAFKATKDELSPLNRPVAIAEKLAALNATLKDERSAVAGFEGPPFLRVPYDLLEPELPYRNLLGQPSSLQLHHPQMNHGRPLFHSLEAHQAHMNSQIKFMGRENIIHHDPQPHHYFPANMSRHPPFQHVPAAPTRGEPPHHSMLPQMHMPNSFQPHLIQGLPRGSPPPLALNQMAGYMSEMNPMQSFPLHHRQPNYNDLGVSMPARGVGGGETNHPEALERLLEMELRANSIQLHPVAASGHSMGMHGHELDMRFRYG
ncbi:hypothetical protein NE237_013638 [Protea cynaroides]|uniref:Uncharacterized protein n=1 Tax=Protea cynaroides TaxID=273540 RepID=A0A9Q0JZZ8_9MAGN|nr:hypothetical protein NE237_013638 [Protea cynaroides]